MFVKLSKQGYAVTIYNDHITLEQSSDGSYSLVNLNEKRVMSETVTIDIDSKQYCDIESRLQSIRLGITENGLDTNTISQQERDSYYMRSGPISHSANWHLINSSYRCFASSRELKYSANQYDITQTLYKIMLDNGFFHLTPADTKDYLIPFLISKIKHIQFKPIVNDSYDLWRIQISEYDNNWGLDLTEIDYQSYTNTNRSQSPDLELGV